MVHCGLFHLLHDTRLQYASYFIPVSGRKESSGVLSFGFSSFLALARCQIYHAILSTLTGGKEGL